MSSTSQVFTVGQVLTAAEMSQLPQGIITMARVTADVGPTSGTTELDVISAPAVTIASGNRRLRIRFHARGINLSVVGDQFVLRIKEGATILQESFSRYEVAAVINNIGCDFEAVVDSPTAASHTYKATIQRNAGTGTATLSASATAAITLTVEDAGQV